MGESRTVIEQEDIEWVVNSTQLPPRPERKPPRRSHKLVMPTDSPFMALTWGP